MDNSKQAFTDYVNLCKLGGSQPFLQLVSSANLQSPFEDGCIEKVMGPINEYLSQTNDMAL